MTLFARQDIRFVYHAKLQILYAMLKKIKIAHVKEMFRRWLETFKASTSISCTSFVTHIATKISWMDKTYISTPRIDIDEHYLMQGHHLKYDDAGNLVFFFLVYTNEIPLPNPGFSLYKSPSLTFTLVEQEEARRSSVSHRGTRSRASDKAGSSQQPPLTPTPTPLVPQAFHTEWFPAMQTPGFTVGYQPGWGHPTTTRGWWIRMARGR